MNEERNGDVHWSDEPPGEEGLFIPILASKPGCRAQAIILSRSHVGVFTHHFERRTRPCAGGRLFCWYCQRKVSRRWKGYFAGMQPGNSKLVLVEFTANAARCCPALIDARRDKRGALLTLWRRNNAANAPVEALLEKPKHEYELPLAFNVKLALRKIWGLLVPPRDDSERGDGCGPEDDVEPLDPPSAE